MALPFAQTERLEQGDSLDLAFPVTDERTRAVVNLTTYDGATFTLTPDDADSSTDPPATVRKTLGDGVTFQANGVVAVQLLATDTDVPPGLYAIRLRLELGGNVRHTLRPIHRLEVAAAPT